MPTVEPPCLTGLTGLSRTALPCFPLPAAPADTAFITDSTTGVYLAEAEGLNLQPATGKAPGSGLYELLDRARNQAINTVETEVGRAYTLGAPLPLRAGLLGGPGGGQAAPVGSPATVTIPVATRPGLGWQLAGLQLYTTTVVTAAPVYLNEVLIGTVTTNGGGFTPATTDAIHLPFDGSSYTLRAELPEGVRPILNYLTCGCANEWVRSVASNILVSAKLPAGGFGLQVREVCTAPEPLCYALEQNKTLRKSVAFAIQYKAAELVVVGFLADAGYSRYTSLDTKALQALIDLYQQNYAGHLAWLSGSEGLSSVAHPCYACKPAGFSYTKSR